MEEPSLALVAAIAAVVASAVGGFFALGGVIVQDRLAARRRLREIELDEARLARHRKLERRLSIMTDTKEATDDIYTLMSTWAFGQDAEQLRETRSVVNPSRHPRADWLYVDNDAAMIAMFEVTRDIVAKGRGAGDREADAVRLLIAYNMVINALIRQEDRVQDGVADLPILGEDGQGAFMSWIPLVEHMRLVP